jgi:hypothetical protein
MEATRGEFLPVKDALDELLRSLDKEVLQLPPPSSSHETDERVASFKLSSVAVVPAGPPLPPADIRKELDALDLITSQLGRAGILRLPPAVPPRAPRKGFTDVYNYATREWEKVPKLPSTLHGKTGRAALEEPSFEPRKRAVFNGDPTTPAGQ